MSGGDTVNRLENSLRDLVESVMTQKYGISWIDTHSGVTPERRAQWEARKVEEPKRRPGGIVEDRILYYSDFTDLVNVIKKNWSEGFKDCFKDRRRFDVYVDRLSAFRNPDAHSRALLPFEESLVEGMSGELRQEITVYLSSGAGGPEPEYFARIEEVVDNLGFRVVGRSLGGRLASQSSHIRRPGDIIQFRGRAWDPMGEDLDWHIWTRSQGETKVATGNELTWQFEVSEIDIGETLLVTISIHSRRPYGALQLWAGSRGVLAGTRRSGRVLCNRTRWR